MLLQPITERPPPFSRKGKKVASSADGGADSGVADDGAALGDVSSPPSIGEDAEANLVACGGPEGTFIAEEAAEQVSLKGGPSEAELAIPVTRRPRGAPTSLKLNVPLAMPMAKKQRVAVPAMYVDDVLVIATEFTASGGV